MNEIVVKNLDVKRFNALVGQSRSPGAAYISEELEWYADSGEIVLGVVLRDTVDNDYVGVLLGRDDGNRFRAIDVQASILTQDEARTWVKGGIKWHSGTAVLFSPKAMNLLDWIFLSQ